MSTLPFDYRLGYRYASELLEDRAARQIEVLIAGLPGWKQCTAKNLIEFAQQRKAEGVNVCYQDGVIARACLELEG